MSTMLTDLMQQLQDVHTYHPGDDGRLMVAVPTTPHTVEQFEVREVHHDGPSVVLHCQPLQDEQARPQDEQDRPQDEQASPPAATTRTCVHNDYEGSALTNFVGFSCGSPSNRLVVAPVNRQRILQIAGGAD